ncbi:MAG: shikimate kinase [Oscillatoria sp. PMC 1068.18]|nr:shikimate kinase [Oscillatoria sp. PMC 1076.18]MEC4989367.1 shikimate kinase [Oscillatoria sp. PMC 1068.18]
MRDLLQGLNVFLIGMMGTGKTTVGQVLAKQLGYRFFDTDILLERVAGKTINEIFAEEGEEKFRDLESKILQELSAYTRSAIATGGGIILRRQNWSYLHHGLIVWLDVPTEILLERLREDKTRPLLQQADLASKLESLLEQRISLYAQADLHISITREQTPEEIADAIASKIPTVLKPEQLPHL